MIKAIALLIYLLNGELKIEQKAYDNMQECRIAAGQRVDAIVALPGFDEGVFAACVETKVTKA